MRRTAAEVFMSLPPHGKIIIRRLNEMLKNQAWLADKCDCSRVAINNVILGKTNPSVNLMVRISIALDMPVEKIFADLMK